MDSARFRRRTIALIAAYAVVLQGLFLAFGPVAPAGQGASFGVLCTHDSDDGSGQGQPANHDLPCAALCAAIGHGMAGPVPSGIAAQVAAFHAVAALVPVSDWVSPLHLLDTPHIPRGPPLA